MLKGNGVHYDAYNFLHWYLKMNIYRQKSYEIIHAHAHGAQKDVKLHDKFRGLSNEQV